MHKYFNPRKFLSITNKILPLSALCFVIFISSGLYYALFNSPADYQQGDSVRIMYVHVPAAWMALGVYSFIGIVSIARLTWKNPFSDVIAISAAPIGAGFTIICLATGALWGKPIWGTWWVWDARLTSVLILLFFYMGYIGLYNSYENKDRAGKTAAILAIFGLINVPIVKFSVDWWNTLHQPASILRSGGIAIHSSMLTPLLLMFLAYISFFLMILSINIKNNLLENKIENKRLSFK